MNGDAEKTWQKLRSERGPDLGLFKTRYDWLRNPRNRAERKVVILEIRDWVNVLPITPQGKLVTVQQYRFGTGKVTTEFPAGLMEDGETSLQAAMRELREETGFTSNEWEYLGYVEPNPAFMGNVCHQWLAHNAVKTEKTELDEGEHIQVEEMNEGQLRQELKAGRLRNALTVLALHRLFDPWKTD